MKAGSVRGALGIQRPRLLPDDRCAGVRPGRTARQRHDQIADRCRRDSGWPVRRRDEAEVEMTQSNTKSPDSTCDIVSAAPPAARALLKLLPCQDRAPLPQRPDRLRAVFVWQIALILWIMGIIDQRVSTNSYGEVRVFDSIETPTQGIRAPTRHHNVSGPF